MIEETSVLKRCLSLIKTKGRYCFPAVGGCSHCTESSLYDICCPTDGPLSGYYLTRYNEAIRLVLESKEGEQLIFEEIL